MQGHTIHDERIVLAAPPNNSYGTLPEKAGKFLITIARQHETTVQGILLDNPTIVRKNDITPGDIIRIPRCNGRTELGELQAWKDKYTVKEGDSLQSIAKCFTTRVEAIIEANPCLADESQDIQGQTIQIPPFDGSGLCTLQADGNQHTVKVGEYLSLIAEWYDTSVLAIVEKNPDIIIPDLIYPRQVIQIPT